jgi:predicted HicB family RNase H-like nuclease
MTPARLGAVPNQPKTPMRSLRVADDLWAAAQVKAAARGETLSDVIRKALERYVKR